MNEESEDNKLRELIEIMKSQEASIISYFEHSQDKRIISSCLDALVRLNGAMKIIKQRQTVGYNTIAKESMDSLASSYKLMRDKAVSSGMDVSQYPPELGYQDPKEN